jgi:hypothetical protein
VTGRARVPFLAAVDSAAVDEALARSYRSRATLERLLAPEVMHALDEYVREVATEITDRLRDELGFAGGKPWLTPAEAGRLLDCSPHAIRMRCSRGRLEHRYQGRRLYVSARAIQELG